MSRDNSDNPLDDRRKAQEEDYFRRQNAALAAKMKVKQDLATAGVKDPQTLERLFEGGFTADSMRALFLVPMIEVAWADGKVEEAEKKEIEALMISRGIVQNSEAFLITSEWLSKDPSNNSTFKAAKELIDPMIQELKQSKGEKFDWVIKACYQVSEATGGFFNLTSKTSKEEAAVIKRVIEKIAK